MLPSRPRILLVDDSPTTRVLLADLLRGRGYEVEESGDGADAIERADRWTPDLVVTDALLPRRDGFEVCAEMRRRGIPVLLVTSIGKTVRMSEEEWRRRSRADGFLSKPFDVRELVGRMERLLEAWRSGRIVDGSRAGSLGSKRIENRED